MICNGCGESTYLENDESIVWSADGDQAAHSYCAYPCSTCKGLAITENEDGTLTCFECAEDAFSNSLASS